MSIWWTKKGPGKKKTILIIGIPWQALPLLIVFVIVLIGVSFRWLNSQWNKPAINSRKDIEGSYRILVCDGPCRVSGAGNVLRQGILVLQNEPLAAEKVDNLFKAWRGRARYPDQAAYRGGVPFGCFSLENTSKKDDTGFSGLIPSDFTIWEENRYSHSIRFWLYRSADGTYLVTGKLADGLFQGEGESHHFGMNFSKQKVIAQRIGPPDVELCLPKKSIAK